MALSDAPAIQRHFNNWNIIRHLARVVPRPYPDDGAETFISVRTLADLRCNAMISPGSI